MRGDTLITTPTSPRPPRKASPQEKSEGVPPLPFSPARKTAGSPENCENLRTGYSPPSLYCVSQLILNTPARKKEVRKKEKKTRQQKKREEKLRDPYLYYMQFDVFQSVVLL